MDVTDTTSFLNSYRLLIDAHLQSIHDLLTDTNISSVCKEYDISKNVQPQKSLNVFSLVSDLYYRENFHSDIICEFLNPAGSHNEGTTFLFAFHRLHQHKLPHPARHFKKELPQCQSRKGI